MSVRRFVLPALVFAVLPGFFGASLAGQSLAGVAKQEEERRKAISQPSKVLTNKDLPAVPSGPGPAGPAAQSAAPADGDKSDPPSASTPDATSDAAPSAKDEGSQKKSEVKDQAYWSGRLQALQAQLGRDQTYADALQTRINVLNADFANRDDPIQRAAVRVDRQKALDELARLTKQLDDDRKAIADLQEEARRAAVPAGWLR